MMSSSALINICLSAQAAHIGLMLDNFSDLKPATNCKQLHTRLPVNTCVADYNYTPMKIFGAPTALIAVRVNLFLQG